MSLEALTTNNGIRRTISMKRKVVLLICILSFSPLIEQAHAYIDPGTGSMIVQAVIGVIVAASVAIGIFWSRVRSFFGRFFGPKKD
jgi:hypothetical protein